MKSLSGDGMANLTSKTLYRSIRSSFGRYAAILAIVAIGVGFFTGLKSARPSMQLTADVYLDRQHMYDLQLLSSLGITSGDVAAFGEAAGVTDAEGGYRLDVLAAAGSRDEQVYQAISIPLRVAMPELISGRMPGSENECLADSAVFSAEDIGTTVSLSSSNSVDTLEQFSQREFTVTGVVRSPRFIGTNRGNTSLGSGKIAGFLYFPADAFRSEVFHEALLVCAADTEIFSDEYDARIEQVSPEVEALLRSRADSRYREIRDDAGREIAGAKEELAAGRAEYEQAVASGIPEEMLADTLLQLEEAEAEISASEEKLAGLAAPKTYVLGVDSNTGCASFKNDIGIIDGIANAFPVFFVLIAALVCITTMTRMVNDERIQIGTLKALGYSDSVISLKYTLYASTASLIGCSIGFFLGTGIIPKIIWAVYAIGYDFSELVYYFSPVMQICCLAVSVVGSAAVTLFACHRELNGKPAELIRPKMPRSGRRVFIEKIKPLWNSLSFLNKVTIRNSFLYKRRVTMMLLGISGCTALMVTGFGLKDSVADVLDNQFDRIMLYDAAVSFDAGPEVRSVVEDLLSGDGCRFVSGYRNNLTVRSGNSGKEATVIAVPPEAADDFFSLHSGKKNIGYPDGTEAVLSSKLAEQLGVEAGGSVDILFGDDSVEFTVRGVCDNYLNHYVYIVPSAVPGYSVNTSFAVEGSAGGIERTAAELRSVAGVNYVLVSSEERAVMEQSMSSMNYIVILVILFAGALAFIVLYNLTNINIIDRDREVATVKVLGFFPAETASYVLRENIMLSVLGGLLGLALGKLLHWYVMLQVQVEAMSFDTHISFSSYVISFFCTVAFAFFSNLVMGYKLEKIDMASSLKSVE